MFYTACVLASFLYYNPPPPTTRWHGKNPACTQMHTGIKLCSIQHASSHLFCIITPPPTTRWHGKNPACTQMHTGIKLCSIQHASSHLFCIITPPPHNQMTWEKTCMYTNLDFFFTDNTPPPPPQVDNLVVTVLKFSFQFTNPPRYTAYFESLSVVYMRSVNIFSNFHDIYCLVEGGGIDCYLANVFSNWRHVKSKGKISWGPKTCDETNRVHTWQVSPRRNYISILKIQFGSQKMQFIYPDRCPLITGFTVIINQYNILQTSRPRPWVCGVKCSWALKTYTLIIKSTVLSPPPPPPRDWEIVKYLRLIIQNCNCSGLSCLSVCPPPPPRPHLLIYRFIARGIHLSATMQSSFIYIHVCYIE